MREIISFHFGQSGAQLASPLWELYCLEHGINLDGSVSNNSEIQENDTNREILFSETQNNRYVPLAYIADDDDYSIDQIKNGQLKKLFSTKSLQEFKGDSGSIWISSYKSAQASENFRNQIHQLLDKCDSLQGIMIYHSVSGGFGGSYASYLLNEFEDDFSKVIKSTVSMLSSDQNSTSTIVEPYNSVFTINQLKQYSNFNIFIDNSALSQVCERQLEIDWANFGILNKMIAQMIASITSTQRLNSENFVDLQDMYQNLVLLPELQFLHTSYAPFIQRDQQNSSSVNLLQISQALFNEAGSFIKFTPNPSQYFGVNLFYRGDCPYSDLQSTINELKNSKCINFADWVPINYQVAMSSKSTVQFHNAELGRGNKTACLVANSTRILNPLKNIQSRFKNLYQKKCFLHWFLKNSQIDESQFVNGLDFFSSLLSNYEQSISQDINQEKQNVDDEASIEEIDEINK
ncbi:unnamed protein product (macronuclear) [Paramecium tetraurelia]|uniref:Alpha-tubulin,putative n=1 Tax=Paramecium tetraurelia TaxID=5888 RepID=Q3SEG4_PARTE|nr:uncharacterized protein GSPATT00004633001 [Paramecium tetraurelia]CAI38960.1 alpha-tubulin,putative [Paramecium tetraurelia]CAK58261.1 unnamed protein product [Paramecium tetraurelia]|eukprot:XP_001425659.1 hypothetical protein (macronuclear) [Paramecium tetraurelia strain d4-2]